MLDEKREFVAQCVMRINSQFEGAYVFWDRDKNMGVFKAVGFPEDVGESYKLKEYSGYLWTAHGRYPTNTPGWWGGAYFSCLITLLFITVKFHHMTQTGVSLRCMVTNANF